MANVFVAGPVSWNQLVYLDRLPEPRPHTVFARRHLQALGGTSAGKSLNLAALGASVTLSTVVGDDEAASWVRQRITAAGIRLLAEKARGPTERHLNLMTVEGQRLSIYLDLSPASHRRPDEVEAALAACDVAVIDLSEHSRPLLAEARAIGRPVWCDIHDYNGADRFHRDFIEAADVLFLNDDGMADPLPFMRDRVTAGAQIVVVTQGAAGATAVTRSGQVHVPSAPVAHIVDTNGAGDAFFAGFLLAHQGGAPLDDALRAGHAQAARCLASPDLAPS
jgi:sugar/nucleoside kinase (ribokinase family)